MRAPSGVLRAGLLAGLLLLLSGPAQARDAAPGDRLTAALQVYRQAMQTPEPSARLERFRQAERLFASLHEEAGVRSSALYVDWANAALQAHRLGPAVLAYRRALRLDPGDRQARENLAEARDLLPAWVPRPRDEAWTGTLFFWRHTLSCSTRGLLSALLFLLACLLLGIWIRWQKGWARNLALLPLLFWLALLAVPWLDASSGAGEDAVVTAEEVLVRAADSPGAPAKLGEPLPGGSEVRITEIRGDWAELQLPDGRAGWVARGRVSFVDPDRP